jgi:hypothetical protein
LLLPQPAVTWRAASSFTQRANPLEHGTSLKTGDTQADGW